MVVSIFQFILSIFGRIFALFLKVKIKIAQKTGYPLVSFYSCGGFNTPTLASGLLIVGKKTPFAASSISTPYSNKICRAASALGAFPATM